MSESSVVAAGGRRDAAPGEERLRERCLTNVLWARFYDGWELIGRGGYGTVIGTRHRTFGEIAVKVFEWLSAHEETRFDQEAAALARLNHPSIVRIYGAFKDDGLYWFEMERVRGSTLKEALETREREERPFTMPEILDIAIDLTEALQAAHAAGVIHRDVKPANVLLPETLNGHGPQAKLGDFGVSRLFDAGRLTATGVVVGSYEYAAPELFSGRTATAASDVYAFTLLLYRLLARNSYPYEINGDRTPVAFMEAHTKQVPIPIGFLNRGLRQELQDVVTLGLSKDPRRRPSWDEILAALRQAQAACRLTKGLPIASTPTDAIERGPRTFLPRMASRPVARYVAPAAVIAALGLTLARHLPMPAASSSRTALGTSPDVLSSRSVAPPSTVPAAAGSPQTGLGSAPTRELVMDSGVVQAAGPAGPERSQTEFGVAVEIAGDALKVRNVSAKAASVRVTVITRSGTRHVATVHGLEAGLQQTIFLDALRPPLAQPKDVVRIEAAEINSSGKRPARD